MDRPRRGRTGRMWGRAVPALLALVATAGLADDASRLDRIWDAATLYESADNPFVQELSLKGRLQADAAFFDAEEGDYEQLTWRRFRLGFKASALGHAVLHAEVDFDLNEFESEALEDTYTRLTDAYVSWTRGDDHTLKIGKQSAPFTLDGATSSKSLLTLERSPVAANLWFPTEYFSGLAGFGRIAGWSYHGGLYSSSGDEEFGSFDSGYFGLVSVGYQAGGLGVRMDYVYNDPDYEGDVGTRDLRHVGSLVAQYRHGQGGLWSDLSLGEGLGDQGDLVGLQLMPFYDLAEDHQLVFRYALVTSSDDNAVRNNRYESRVVSGRVDELQEYYLGYNWFFHGHQLKWQNGVEYTRATDAANDGGAYDGWGFTTGLRIGW